MMRAELKKAGREQIKGNLWILFGLMLLMMLMIGGAGGFSGMLLGIAAAMGNVMGMIIAFLVYLAVIFLPTPAFSLSLTQIYLGLARGEKPKVVDLFKGFKQFWKAAGLFFLVMLYTLLWSLLLIVPGIIKSFSYSQCFYVLAENPDMSASEALKKSVEIMNGHKMEMFVLYLSFLGWMLLPMVPIVLTTIDDMAIIGGLLALAGYVFLYFYVMPYLTATFTNFYLDIKGEKVSES